MPWVRHVAGELVAALRAALREDANIDEGFCSRAVSVLERARPVSTPPIAVDPPSERTVRLVPAADLVVTRVTVLPRREPVAVG